MKRIFILIILGLVLGAFVCYADTSVVVDFTKLGADVQIGKVSAPNENSATLIDFSSVAGASFTDEEKAAMKTSLALDNWVVELASSSRSIQNQAASYTREATMKPTAKQFQGVDMAGKNVLGVRVHFPVDPFASWALVEPPFDIPAYADKDTLQGDKLTVADADRGLGAKFENGFGVVKNVGIIKSVSMTVYGSNFPNGIGLQLIDQDGATHTIFMDYLQFDGWKTLTWENPDYVTEVRNRELKRYPLYPNSEPYVKIGGIVFYRDAAQQGGDLVAYIRDISITYDKAILDTERDINDEGVWGILQAREEARRVAEAQEAGGSAGPPLHRETQDGPGHGAAVRSARTGSLKNKEGPQLVGAFFLSSRKCHVGLHLAWR